LQHAAAGSVKPPMDKRNTILRVLADGKFHSGEELAAMLDVSRASVWKHLNILKDLYSLNIHSVRGRGYRLGNPLDLLDAEQIKAQIHTLARPHISRLEVHDQINSTNSYLMGLALEGADSGVVCIAEQQTAGRGRRGRTWVSPFGCNIYLSILWRYSVGMADLSGISIAAGVAVARTLENLGVEGVGLKWPNDILLHDRKLAGLLLEVAGEQNGPSRVVLGVGLNTLLTPQDAEPIDQPWIDLSGSVGGESISRNTLSAMLVSELVTMMSCFETDRLSGIMEEWSRFDLHYNQEIIIRMNEQKQVVGIHKGIDDSGALLLQIGDEIKAYHGGEVSLRPVT